MLNLLVLVFISFMHSERQFQSILEDMRQIKFGLARVTDYLLDAKPDLDQMAKIKGLVQPATGIGFRVVPFDEPEPGTLTERVVAIFRDSKVPLMPKGVAKEYYRRGWTKPRRGGLYGAVSGTISYLLNTKKVLRKDERGYSLVINLSEVQDGSRQQEARV